MILLPQDAVREEMVCLERKKIVLPKWASFKTEAF